MRSSNKSRSRNKSNNRNRNIGNVVNRVFDSAGPEGKVRGTPQQIVEKYQGLTRDAQLSGDRVAAENFQQHAEHYLRMLNDAQREQAERQAADAQKRQQQQPNQQPDVKSQDGAVPGDVDHTQPVVAQDNPQPPVEPSSAPAQSANDVLGEVEDEGSNLVETPEAASNGVESAPTRKPRGRTRRSAPKEVDGGEADPQPTETAPIQ
ncbi:MAG: DUF4167 domain-containing protein [Pseudomonadota bacterium]